MTAPPAADGSPLVVAVDRLRASTQQPRRVFDAAALEHLTASIREHGVLQPLLVRPAGGGDAEGWEIIAGERRWRAARAAGLTEVPVVVKGADDERSAVWALIENLHRSDLNPMEQARGLRELTTGFGLGPTDLAKRVGLDRSTVSNLLRLNDLETDIQDRLMAGELSSGHGKALLSAPAGDVRCVLAARAAAQGWSVRQTERACRVAAERAGGATAEEGSVAEPPTDAAELNRRRLEERLASHLGTKVRIDVDAAGSAGRLVVRFYDLDQFDGVLRAMGLPSEDEV